MKTNFTFCSRQTEFAKIAAVIMLFFSSFILYSCASTARENVVKKSETDIRQGNEKVFTFHRDKNGKDNLWKAVFKDGRLTELFKNEQKIPDEYLEDYADMVNEELGGVQNNHHNYGENSYRFDVDMRDFDSTLSHLGDYWGNIDYDNCDSVFDSGQFHNEIDSLKRDMKKLHKMKFNFHFDTTAFNKGMRDLRKSLKNLKINPHMYLYKNGFPGVDMEAFKEGMKNFDKEMKHNRIFNEDFKIDMSEFENKMKDFDKSMKNFGLNMKDFSKNMKKLEGFLKDLKHELVRDNLIKDEDENFSMKFNSKEMIINGNKLPESLLEKYKEIYKKHYGKDIENDFKITNNNDGEPDIDEE